MTERILLVGAGGHCRSCIEAVESSHQWQIGGVVATADEIGRVVLGYPVVGTDDDLQALASEFAYALVAIGQIRTAENRRRVFDGLKTCGFSLPVVSAATAVVSRHSQLKEGTIIMHGGIVNAGAQVGNNVIVNSRALIEHDVFVGDHCHISTGATLNGGAVVEDASFIGSGTVIYEGVRVGRESVVGAGLMVSEDLPPRSYLRGRT